MNLFLKCVIGIILCLCLTGCFVKPYKFDIKQGNVISDEMVAQIQPGMSQEQVLYLLGTPLLHDIFHINRWDYIYYDKPGYQPPLKRHLAIYFENGQVEQITNDPLEVGVENVG